MRISKLELQIYTMMSMYLCGVLANQLPNCQSKKKAIYNNVEAEQKGETALYKTHNLNVQTILLLGFVCTGAGASEFYSIDDLFHILHDGVNIISTHP